MRQPGYPVSHDSRGASMVETLLVLCVLAALVLVALERFVFVRVEAERVAVESVVKTLQAAALERDLQNSIDGYHRNVFDLPGSNPMILLPRPPLNYLGELAGPDPATIAGGQWYFDTRSRQLVYRVEHEAYFDTALPGAPVILFKVGVKAADIRHDGDLPPTRDEAHGLTIEALNHYSWRRYPVRVGALAVWGVVGTTL